MDKIVLDSFKLTTACYDKFPTDPTKKDECRVDAEIHERGKTDPPNVIHFYRNKTNYLFGPEDAPKVPRLRELGFDDQNISLQNSVSSAVELNYVAKTDLLDKNPNLKSALAPVAAKMIDLIVAGEIASPDERQKNSITAFFQSLEGLNTEEQAALLRFVTSLTQVEWLTDAHRPRAEWLLGALKFADEIAPMGASLEADAEAQKKWKALPFEIWIYLATEASSMKTLRARVDELQGLLQKNPKAPTDAKELYGFLLKKLDPLGKGPWLSNNLEARTRYNKLLGEWALAKTGSSDDKKRGVLDAPLAPIQKKGDSVVRNIVFPITHGTVLAGGISLFSYGLTTQDQYGIRDNAFYHTGAGLMGFGAGALTCNLAWKQKNAGMQFLTDTLCGLAVGAAATGLSFAVQGVDSKGTGGGPQKDGRNPVSPYGP